MGIEIYIDTFFLENLVIDYLILWVAGRFSKAAISSLRLLLGALVGASYAGAMVLFFSNQHVLNAYFTAVSKILVSFVMVALAFHIDKLKTFIKLLVVLYVTTFVFAGAAFAFFYFNQNSFVIANGMVYIPWESNWPGLIISLLTAAILLKVFWEQIQYKLAREKLLRKLKISFDQREIYLPALVDTGNYLHDPISNMPVVVVEFSAVKEILPAEIQEIFIKSRENDLACVTGIVSNSTWNSRFRLIPFTSLGKENGMLIGFRPDFIEVGDEADKKDIREVIVGIYNRALARNASYKALLSPELVA